MNCKNMCCKMICFKKDAMSERNLPLQDSYASKYKKQYSLPCFTTTEQDITEKLESVPNKAGYIKQLIRADIAERKRFLLTVFVTS